MAGGKRPAIDFQGLPPECFGFAVVVLLLTQTGQLGENRRGIRMVRSQALPLNRQGLSQEFPGAGEIVEFRQRTTESSQDARLARTAVFACLAAQSEALAIQALALRVIALLPEKGGKIALPESHIGVVAQRARTDGDGLLVKAFGLGWLAHLLQHLPQAVHACGAVGVFRAQYPLVGGQRRTQELHGFGVVAPAAQNPAQAHHASDGLRMVVAQALPALSGCSVPSIRW